MHRRVAVVAVLGLLTEARWDRAGFAHHGRVSVAIAVLIGVAGDQREIIDAAVAVVVDAVTQLRCARMHRRVAVVAVLCRSEAVAVAVDVADRWFGVLAGEEE